MSEIELQRRLLGDSVRNNALHAALAKLIKPGVTTVADLGAGTGFLSFLARQLGAKSCDLYEYSGTLELARTLARANKLSGLRFVHAHSGDVSNPAKVDLVVAEILGNFALEEQLLETLNDARRFLKPGGTLLPCGLRQFVAPVVQPRLQREIDIWSQVGFEVDLSAARETSLNNMYVKTVRSADLAGGDSARQWDRIEFKASGKLPSSRRGATVEWTFGADAPATIHGLALWWIAELAPGISLSTAPDAALTHWEQIYLPMLEPLAPKAGDTLDVELRSDTATDVRLRWTTRLRRGAKVLIELKQDSFRGRL